MEKEEKNREQIGGKKKAKKKRNKPKSQKYN